MTCLCVVRCGVSAPARRPPPWLGELVADQVAEIRNPGAQARADQSGVSRDVDRNDAAIHSLVDVWEDWIRCSRPAERIEVEAELDGVYIIRTTLKAEQLRAAEAVEWPTTIRMTGVPK